MFITWMLFTISVIACHEVNESAEETNSKYNITTLYPVANKTINNIKEQRNRTETQLKKIKFNEKDEDEKQNIASKEKLEINLPIVKNISTWTIDATFSQLKDIDNIESNTTDSKEHLTVEPPINKTKEKEFKTSPHLGNFFDEENLNLLKFSTSEANIPIKRPITDLTRAKDLHMLNYKSPKDSYGDEVDAPYRFESSYFPETKNWKQTLESYPTVESAIKIPAGGLYKYTNPFKEKPSNNGDDDDDFGLGFDQDGKGKGNPTRKRSNPWKGLLNLVTALLPVGLIISALTPNVITIHSTDSDPHVNRFSRRADEVFTDVPSISEQCKRRLLCEIHSEQNYVRSQEKVARYARKHCYKIRCDDAQALNTVLRWLLAHRSTTNRLPETNRQPGTNLQPGNNHEQPGSHRPRIPYRTEHNSDSVYYRHRN